MDYLRKGNEAQKRGAAYADRFFEKLGLALPENNKE